MSRCKHWPRFLSLDFVPLALCWLASCLLFFFFLWGQTYSFNPFSTGCGCFFPVPYAIYKYIIVSLWTDVKDVCATGLKHELPCHICMGHRAERVNIACNSWWSWLWLISIEFARFCSLKKTKWTTHCCAAGRCWHTPLSCLLWLLTWHGCFSDCCLHSIIFISLFCLLFAFIYIPLFTGKICGASVVNLYNLCWFYHFGTLTIAHSAR